MNRRHAFKVAIASVVGLVTASTAKAAPLPFEERWHTPNLDEDIWIPIRPNSERRVFSVELNMSPEKADEYMKRLKEQFAKKKLCRR
jgi:hypothetical protein